VITPTGSSRRLGAGIDHSVESRLPVLATLIVLAFIVFAVRLFQLQIVQSDELKGASQGNSVRTVRLDAPRGDILDREGRVLAATRPAFGLQVVPHDLHQPDLTFTALGMLLDEDDLALRERVGTPSGRKRFAPVRLVDDLPYDRWAGTQSHLYALPGVSNDVQPRRHYLGGELAAHLLGYLGEIDSKQLERPRFAGYRMGDVIGQAGVESLYQSSLRGRAGGRNQVVDVSGRVRQVLDEVEPLPGGDLMLTLDLDLQKAAEEAFAPPAEGEPEKWGAVVALDPRNGDVLALVSRPAFDPNDFAGGIDAETWKGLTTDEWRPLQNRAISGVYPPGSTYKVITAAAALEEGIIGPRDSVFCPGTFRLGRRTYRCWKRRGHGAVDLYRALVESCDVYFYTVGLEVGVDRLARYANGFNLGRLTGIALPQENAGLVPTSRWKERRHREPWQRGETVSTSIGQGFNLATPLQMAVAYAAIANGGQLVRPRLVLAVEGDAGTMATGPAPETTGRVPVSDETLTRLLTALEGVVSESHGTGGRARVRGVRVGGKTGTSQVVRMRVVEDMEEDEIPIRYRDHAWFVGVAPIEAPEIVVAALVEHGGHGGAAAGPVVQRVLARYFEKKKTRRAAGSVVASVQSGEVTHAGP
jgi:penicillin-binding protein 2